MPPCAHGLLASKIKAAKWRTRIDLVVALEQADQYLAQQHRANVRLVELGREVGLSPYYVNRLFRLAFGTTPQQRSLEYALQFAFRALRTGQLVADVSAQAGFSDSTTFGRAFKRRYGVNPSLAHSILQVKSN